MRLHSFEAFRVVGPFVDSTCAKTFLDVRPWCPRRRASAHARGRRRRAAVSRRRCVDRRIGTRLGRVSHSSGPRWACSWSWVCGRRLLARSLRSTRRCRDSSTPPMRTSTCYWQRSPLRLRCLGQAPGPSMRACSAGGASKSATATQRTRNEARATPLMRVSRAPPVGAAYSSVVVQNTDRAVNPHQQRLARDCRPAR